MGADRAKWRVLELFSTVLTVNLKTISKSKTLAAGSTVASRLERRNFDHSVYCKIERGLAGVARKMATITTTFGKDAFPYVASCLVLPEHPALLPSPAKLLSDKPILIP